MPEPTTPPNPDELQRLQDQIDDARDTAEDNGSLPDPDEPRFYESGSIRPEDDDQAIAP